MPKKLTALFLLLCFLCAGCTQTAAQPQSGAPLLPDTGMEFPATFTFSSGAGAWATNLTLNANGTFQGDYHDSEMGLTDEGYPNGTVYICTFHGQFTDAQPIDEYSYRLTLSSLTADGRPEQEIRDGILYAAAGPHGLTCREPYSSALARDFVLYTPDTPIAGLNEEFLSWWPGRFEADPPEILDCYALWNTDSNTGFFSLPRSMMN